MFTRAQTKPRTARTELATLIAALSAFALLSAASVYAHGAEKDEDYDRLDGMGLSGKKVNVVEWEGNLEVHVYPGGSLAGLSLKLDKKNKNKPVMVIGYRFTNNPKQTLIRRAILGTEFVEGFKAYRDPSSGSEYDKIVISNNGLAGNMIAFKLDAEPTQLYPDGHPALAQQPEPEKRKPASAKKAAPKAELDDNGTIQPFFMGNE